VKIEPILRSSLVDTVVERIRGMIEQGQLQAGDRLPTETELVERLGVSRGALREAIRRLETLGLLTVAQGRGMFVADNRSLSNCVQLFRSAMALSPRDALQFAEFRRMIECSTARRAAERATPEDVTELEAICERKNEGGASAEGVHWDWKFHRKLAEIAGNEVVLNVMTVLQEFLVAGIWQSAQAIQDGDQQQRARHVHEAIIKAIRAGDADAAEQAMQAHMDALVSALHRSERAGEPASRRPRRKVEQCAV
jgi:GntR family transcriptional repressor for pyruvate dehydrogenase complex